MWVGTWCSPILCTLPFNSEPTPFYDLLLSSVPVFLISLVRMLWETMPNATLPSRWMTCIVLPWSTGLSWEEMKFAWLNLFSANLSWLFNHLLSFGSVQIISVLLFSQTNEIRLVRNSSALLPPHYLLRDWHNFGQKTKVFCHFSFPIALKTVIDGRDLMSLLCKWFLCSHLLWSRLLTSILQHCFILLKSRSLCLCPCY